MSLCTVPLEVGPDQPRHWLRAAVLKHGESAAAVRMGGNGEAIPRGLCARTAAEGEAPQLQVAGQAPKTSPFNISLHMNIIYEYAFPIFVEAFVLRCLCQRSHFDMFELRNLILI